MPARARSRATQPRVITSQSGKSSRAIGGEEDVPRDVALLDWPAFDAGQRPQSSQVGGEQVHGAAEHAGRDGAQAKVVQELVLGFPETQRLREGVEDGWAGVDLAAVFQADVVVDAHPGGGGPRRRMRDYVRAPR
ncbi:hypothetical protein GCM10022403_048210 [Streptomyces coacervatus]|uniref:Uncharacterized protein n=1 Tax=Streptomyces coacervatus TaxID=647381 RepID=A0ABP7I2Q3_9ACTN